MPIHFLDSSAVVKRYVSERGTAWVQSLFDPAAANRISIAAIAGAEVVSAVARKAHGGGMTTAEASRAIRAFTFDFRRDFEVLEVNSVLIERAMGLAERYALRGYDAVQLAAAKAVHSAALIAGIPMTLVSSDMELNSAATMEGMAVDDPNAHP